MGLRDALNQNSTVVTVIALLVLGVCVLLIGRVIWGGPASGPGDIYYYDLNTGKVFVGVAQPQEPVDAPSGETPEGKPAGVRATILACGKCRSNFAGMTADEIKQAGAELAYLLINPPMPTGDPSGPGTADPRMLMMPDPVIRTVDGSDWIRASSAEGLALMSRFKDQCEPGTDVVPCNP